MRWMMDVDNNNDNYGDADYADVDGNRIHYIYMYEIQLMLLCRVDIMNLSYDLKRVCFGIMFSIQLIRW